MIIPVFSYMVVISVMVALAIGTAYVQASVLIPIGALAFYVSDISVARDRFVASSRANKLWGLPAYASSSSKGRGHATRRQRSHSHEGHFTHTPQ